LKRVKGGKNGGVVMLLGGRQSSLGTLSKGGEMEEKAINNSRTGGYKVEANSRHQNSSTAGKSDQKHRRTKIT